MVVPKINSSHGSETRNIINTAIDSINVQGKTIQDLVAEGQLTEEQYDRLITSVNGLISRGDVSVYDIDKNKGKLDGTYFSEKFLSELNNSVINTTNVLPNSIGKKELIDGSVEPRNLSYMEKTKNLFNGYDEIMLMYVTSGHLYSSDPGSYDPRTAVVPLEPGETYTVKIYGDKTAFRIYILNNAPVLDGENHAPDEVVLDNGNIDEYTFTNTASGKYALIFVSGNGSEPKMQVEKGEVSTPYKEPYYIPVEMLDESLTKTEDNVNATVIERPRVGYGDRPNTTSVTWIGPNEPIGAEPYDEWRETGGFSYYTDFTDITTSEISRPWVNSGTLQIINSSTSPESGGGKVLEMRPTSNGMYAVEWDVTRDDPGKDDAEIFVRARLSTPGGSQSLSALIRASGNTSSHSGYALGPRDNGTGRIAIVYYENGTSTILGETPTNVDFTNYFNMVARAEGPELKMKVWQDGDQEPSEWMLEVQDFLITTGDFLGVFHYLASPAYVDALGISAGGMRAPRRG